MSKPVTPAPAPDALRAALEMLVDFHAADLTSTDFEAKYGRDMCLDDVVAVARLALAAAPRGPEPAELRAALKPFAAAARYFDGQNRESVDEAETALLADNTLGIGRLTIGDLRRAAHVLAAAGQPPEPSEEAVTAAIAERRYDGPAPEFPHPPSEEMTRSLIRNKLRAAYAVQFGAAPGRPEKP